VDFDEAVTRSKKFRIVNIFPNAIRREGLGATARVELERCCVA